MQRIRTAGAVLILAISLPTSGWAQGGAALEAALRARLAHDTAVVAVAVHDPASGLKAFVQADLRFSRVNL
jgi:hypothetical protein